LHLYVNAECQSTALLSVLADENKISTNSTTDGKITTAT
jgi:hypothetical protein